MSNREEFETLHILVLMSFIETNLFQVIHTIYNIFILCKQINKNKKNKKREKVVFQKYK